MNIDDVLKKCVPSLTRFDVYLSSPLPLRIGDSLLELPQFIRYLGGTTKDCRAMSFTHCLVLA